MTAVHVIIWQPNILDSNACSPSIVALLSLLGFVIVQLIPKQDNPSTAR